MRMLSFVVVVAPSFRWVYGSDSEVKWRLECVVKMVPRGEDLKWWSVCLRLFAVLQVQEEVWVCPRPECMNDISSVFHRTKTLSWE